MLKAILFDMDGVIIDSEPLHKQAYQKMFADYQITVSESLYESFTGQATLPICEHLCEYFSLSVPPEELVAAKRNYFKALFESDNDLALIKGVLDRIQEYHQKGIILILASSASMPTINRIFKRFNLDPYFKAKLSGADLTASKPHPEIFIKAAAASGYSKAECMVIEDSTNGIKAAHSAGIFCTAFQGENAHNQDYQLAGKVIQSFAEISVDRLPEFFPAN